MQQMNSALASRVSNNIIHSVLFSCHLFISHVIAWEYPLAPVATDDMSAKTSRLIFFLLIIILIIYIFSIQLTSKWKLTKSSKRTRRAAVWLL